MLICYNKKTLLYPQHGWGTHRNEYTLNSVGFYCFVFFSNLTFRKTFVLFLCVWGCSAILAVFYWSFPWLCPQCDSAAALIREIRSSTKTQATGDYWKTAVHIFSLSLPLDLCLFLHPGSRCFNCHIIIESYEESQLNPGQESDFELPVISSS